MASLYDAAADAVAIAASVDLPATVIYVTEAAMYVAAAALVDVTPIA